MGVSYLVLKFILYDTYLIKKKECLAALRDLLEWESSVL